jgi:hypothetical protein
MASETKRLGNALIGTGFLAMLLLSPLHGQTSRHLDTGRSPDCGLFSDLKVGLLTAGQVLREIDDPATGGRWLLFRDDVHFSGPGRLVRVANSDWRCETLSQVRVQGEIAHSGADSSRIAVHAGEMLFLEQHTAVLDAQLEAIALGQAAFGERLKVRLKMNGKVVHAVATGTGRAEMVPADGANR